MSAKPNKQMIVRAIVVMVVTIFFFTFGSGASLVNIMIIKGEDYQSRASEQQLYDTLISAPRGNIYDCKMNKLATSSNAWTVYITPNSIAALKKEDDREIVRQKIAEGLSSILELDKDEIYEKTKKKTYYVIVKKKIEKEAADKVRKFISDNKDLEMTKYIGLDVTTKRYYPNDTLASCVIGFVGDDNQGLAGLESYYDNELTGMAGRVVAAKNALGTEMPFTYEKVEESVQGGSLLTTIDSYIQYVAEKHLDNAIDEFKIAERGAVIVMDVNTGAIKGMAVSGDFNPNSPFTLSAEDEAKIAALTDDEEKTKLRSTLLNRQWRNKAVSDTYEPGSVFKIFTASTALEENLVTEKSTFTCNWLYTVASQPYHCHKRAGHGIQTLGVAISNSCNPAFIQIGQLIGIPTFSKYFKAFGLTEKTGIDLPGEALPYYHKEENMGATELASSSFGQTFNITPMHMISLAAAAVNGGYLVQPHIVDKILDSDNKVIKTMSASYKRQVISSSTSATMRKLLEYVVQNGAKNGIVAGYRVGGKTGTSQKVADIISRGVDALYIGSYVGIAPIDDPGIAVFVMLDEPTGSQYYGGAIAAPVGSKIMTDILPYLGYEPNYSAAELEKISVAVPDVTGLLLEAAKEKLSSSKLSFKLIGNGSSVIKQLPAAGNSVNTAGTVILYTEESGEQTTTVPNLIGLTASQVNKAAADANINIEFSGNTTLADLKAYRQSVPAGESVPIGKIVTVYFRDDASADIAPE